MRPVFGMKVAAIFALYFVMCFMKKLDNSALTLEEPYEKY
jgi:hypothetical protein